MPYLQTSTFATSHVGNSCRCWPGIKWGAQSCFKNQDSKQHLHLQLPPPVATGEHLTPAAAGQESKEQISLPESIFQGSTCDHKFPTPAATSQESKQVHSPASKSGFRAPFLPVQPLTPAAAGQESTEKRIYNGKIHPCFKFRVQGRTFLIFHSNSV